MATVVGLRRRKRRIASDEFIEIEVVDGQQRLTTLTILLKSISKAMKDIGEERSKEIDSILVKGDDLSLLLLQTNHDLSHIFTDYVRDGAVPTDKPKYTSDRNLIDAINECERFVAAWSTDSGGTLTDLFGTIKNRLSMIFHEIEDEALVYTVFEVLNSRGLDVTWFDKLKSLLMSIIFEYGDEGSKKETVKELHKLWTEIYTTIGLRQNLNLETVRFAGTLRAPEPLNRPLSEEDAVRVLVEGCEKNPKRVVSCTKWLLSVTQAEDKLLANHRLKAVTGILQARLVAMSVLLRQFPAKEERQLLDRWEKVTFRIFGLARKDARQKVGDYVRLSWKIMNRELSCEEILQRLDRIGSDFPIGEVIQEIENSDCYQGWTEQLRYLFFCYEEHLAREAGQSLNESQWNRIWADEPSRSIEHIWPRSRGSEDPETKEIFVHRLGNLMLLPPGVNSKLQDKKPRQKSESYDSCGLLLAIEVAKLIETGKWDRSLVEKRERNLINWVRQRWSD